MNKRNTLIVLIAACLILGILVFVLLQRDRGMEVVDTADDFEVVFMEDSEKANYGLAEETKVQVFYDSDGYLMYKIIRDDSDVITDPVEGGLIRNLE